MGPSSRRRILGGVPSAPLQGRAGLDQVAGVAPGGLADLFATRHSGDFFYAITTFYTPDARE